MRRSSRISLASLLAAAQLAHGAAGELAEPAALDEIVIVGQKRELTDLEFAGTVTALSGEELVHEGINGIEELSQKSLNFSYLEYGDGQYRLAYRGIGATGTSDNQNFNVAIDGMIVPYGRAYRPLDLRSVEIYLGPQGTTYGRNAAAGVVAITTNDGSEGSPNLLGVSLASFNTQSATLAAGGFLEGDDGFFYRIAARGHGSDGYHENRLIGDDRYHEQRDHAARVALGYRGDDWTAKLSYLNDRYDVEGGNLSREQTPYQVNTKRYQPEYAWGGLDLPMLLLERTFSDRFKLRYNGNYADADRVVALAVQELPTYIAQSEFIRSHAHELRINSIAPAFGRMDWFLGFSYLDEDQRYANDLDLYDLADFLAGDPNNETTPPVISQLLFQEQDKNTQTFALFGESAFRLAERWTVGLGARLARERQRFRYFSRDSTSEVALVGNSEVIIDPLGTSISPGQVLPPPADPTEPVITRGSGRETFDSFSPKASLTFFPSSASSVYASYTQGFRAGSFFVQNLIDDPDDGSFDSEITHQYEVGAKASLLDGRLDLSAALYHIDWKNLQVQVAVDAGSVVVDNAADARSRGFELKLRGAPTSDLQVQLGFGMVDARYLDFVTANGNDVGGNRIEGTPRYSGMAALDYDLPWNAGIGLDYVRYGDTNWDPGEIPGFQQAPYGVLNARLSWQYEPFRADLLGKNLTDTAYASRGVGAITVPDDQFGYFGAPRNVEFALSLAF